MTQVDEGIKCWNLLATKMIARTVVGRGEEGLLCYPGSEIPRTGRERDKSSPRIVNGIKKTMKKEVMRPYLTYYS